MVSSRPYVYVHTIGGADLDRAAELLGRGMADNPVHLAAYGDDEAVNARRHGLLMRALLRHSPSMRIEAVDRGDELAAVAASAPPGECQPASSARLRLLGRAATFGLGTAARLLAWKAAWGSHDPGVPHVHLGPVSVDRHLRGQGLGSLLMLRHVGRLDATGAIGYLETDRPEAVGFYRRFGYVVVGEAEVLGVPCWFMRRPAV